MMEAARQQGVRNLFMHPAHRYMEIIGTAQKEGQEGELLSPYALTRGLMKSTVGYIRNCMVWIPMV